MNSTTTYEAALAIRDAAQKNYHAMSALFMQFLNTLGPDHRLTRMADAECARAATVWNTTERTLRETPKPFNETVWKTGDGRKVRIKDMDDSHLINVIWWVHGHLKNYTPDMLTGLVEEANRRKLPWSAPIPFKHYNDEFRR